MFNWSEIYVVGFVVLDKMRGYLLRWFFNPFLFASVLLIVSLVKLTASTVSSYFALCYYTPFTEVSLPLRIFRHSQMRLRVNYLPGVRVKRLSALLKL